MYQQRATPPDRAAGSGPRRWLSQAPLVGEAAGTDGARYVVIDDLDDDLAVLEVSPWPVQDAAGRLTFGDPDRRAMWSVPAAAFHRRVTAARAESGQQAADRPLRIGDAFFAQVTDDDESIDSVERIHDVTREARDQAKLAHFAAVTPRVGPDEAHDLTLAETEGEVQDAPPPAGTGPSASPAV